jgi:hypothetical protein
MVNIMEFNLINLMYYFGVFLGYTIWMFYLYWEKNKSNPTPFDKKYLVPWIITTLIAVLQLVLELANAVIPIFEDPVSAFIAGFTVYLSIQEIIKGALKYPKIDYFNK